MEVRIYLIHTVVPVRHDLEDCDIEFGIVVASDRLQHLSNLAYSGSHCLFTWFWSSQWPDCETIALCFSQINNTSTLLRALLRWITYGRSCHNFYQWFSPIFLNTLRHFRWFLLLQILLIIYNQLKWFKTGATSLKLSSTFCVDFFSRYTKKNILCSFKSIFH